MSGLNCHGGRTGTREEAKIRTRRGRSHRERDIGGRAAAAGSRLHSHHATAPYCPTIAHAQYVERTFLKVTKSEKCTSDKK